MEFPRRTEHGYSLVELILVVTIVSILAFVAATQAFNRGGSAVRSLLDTLEGAIAEAHKATVATGRDTYLVSYGTWTAANPLVLAYGDATMAPATIQGIANNLLAVPPVLPVNSAANPYATGVGVPFFFQPNDRIQSRAMIVLAGSGNWNSALLQAGNGQSNPNITTVTPFGAGQAFNGLVADANLLCTGLVNQVLIGGQTQRFNTFPNPCFIIEVVATVGSNSVVEAGGAMGLLVVQNNGNSVYKFYNPGVLYGDGKWRRI